MNLEQLSPKLIKFILTKKMNLVAKKYNFKPIDAFEFALDQKYQLRFKAENNEVKTLDFNYEEVMAIAFKLEKAGYVETNGLELRLKEGEK